MSVWGYCIVATAIGISAAGTVVLIGRELFAMAG